MWDVIKSWVGRLFALGSEATLIQPGGALTPTRSLIFAPVTGIPLTDGLEHLSQSLDSYWNLSSLPASRTSSSSRPEHMPWTLLILSLRFKLNDQLSWVSTLLSTDLGTFSLHNCRSQVNIYIISIFYAFYTYTYKHTALLKWGREYREELQRSYDQRGK